MATSRNRILDCFALLLSQHGYGNTSIGDVAAQAEVSKGTIMHHFASKEQMLVEIQMAFMDRRLKEAETIVEVFTTPVDRLSAMIYSLLRIHRDDQIASRTFMREYPLVTESDSMADVRKSREQYEEVVRDIIRQGMDEGVFRQADVVMTSMQIFGMCNHAWSWYKIDGPYSILEITESYLMMVFGGLLESGVEVQPEAIATTLERAEDLLVTASSKAA